jgi:hypothetical protein
MPVFFGKNYPIFKSEYALVNAAILSGCGLTASILSGFLSDKLENRSLWAKGLICMIG